MRTSDLVRNAGQHFELLRVLTHTVFDHGGDDSTLTRILKDQELRVQIAKILVGRLWDFADRTFSLEVDWDTPYETIVADDKSPDVVMTGFKLSDVSDLNLFKQAEKPPQGTHYTILHCKDEGPTEVFQHNGATFRELHAFAKIVGAFSKPCEVMAPGSLEQHTLYSGDPPVQIMPMLTYGLWDGTMRCSIKPYLNNYPYFPLRNNDFVLARVLPTT